MRNRKTLADREANLGDSHILTTGFDAGLNLFEGSFKIGHKEKGKAARPSESESTILSHDKTSKHGFDVGSSPIKKKMAFSDISVADALSLADNNFVKSITIKDSAENILFNLNHLSKLNGLAGISLRGDVSIKFGVEELLEGRSLIKKFEANTVILDDLPVSSALRFGDAPSVVSVSVNDQLGRIGENLDDLHRLYKAGKLVDIDLREGSFKAVTLSGTQFAENGAVLDLIEESFFLRVKDAHPTIRFVWDESVKQAPPGFMEKIAAAADKYEAVTSGLGEYTIYVGYGFADKISLQPLSNSNETVTLPPPEAYGRAAAADSPETVAQALVAIMDYGLPVHGALVAHTYTDLVGKFVKLRGEPEDDFSVGIDFGHGDGFPIGEEQELTSFPDDFAFFESPFDRSSGHTPDL